MGITLLFRFMSLEINKEAFYKKLKGQLEDTSDWPSLYLYKFIVLSNQEKIQQIEQVFSNTGAVITTKKSKNGKYTSVSVKVRMKDPDAVIEKYQTIGNTVEGVIPL